MAVTEASDVGGDGPVLSVINKRIRALRKKLNRISQMEESLSKGKTLNKEQEETLRTKPAIVAGIEELEKIRLPISAAVEEEISIAAQNHQAPTQEAPVAATTNEETPEEPEKVVVSKGEEERLLVAEDLLNLMYFGCMFDVKNLQNHFAEMMLSREHERGSCLSYDYMKDDDSIDLLNERDLDLLSMLSGLLISRPVNSSLPHKNALQRCIEHAKLWLENSTQPIESDSDVTYAGLRSKLNKIMASQYFVAAPVGLQTATMSYGSFQVPLHESVPPLDVPVAGQVHVEDNGVQYQQKEVEGTASYHGNETYNYQANHEDQHQQVEENTSDLPAKTEHIQPEVEGTHDHSDDRGQQQQAPRRPYQNQNNPRGGARGGGRGRYSNGRGGRGGRGGSYQNGRNNHYDQPGGNNIPRNSHFRGRGRRGGGHYGNHPFGGQAGNYEDEYY